VDAATLAQLLRADLLPEAWIAPPATRDLRAVLGHRASLVRMGTACKNRIHAVLADRGIPDHSSLWTGPGRAWLADLELPATPRGIIQDCCGLLDALATPIARLEREIAGLAKPDPRVQALMVLPGVGRLTAMTLVAEIGDIGRFPTARKLCAWAGLTPQVRNSDRKVRHGHITKQGSPWVRGIPQEAARGPNGCMRANSEPVRAFSLLRSRHHHNPARPRADPARPDNARPHGCGNAGPHSGDSKIHGKDGATRL
jgi:transposase